MATLNLKTWLTSSKISSATYDDQTGIVSLDIASGLTTDENVLKEIILGIEESAQGKRTNLNSPISEKSFADDPRYNFVNRQDANLVNSEVQIEYLPQFVLWLKAVNPVSSDAVNDND